MLGLLKGILSMEHPIEKPSESDMRFFTPERYVRFNSLDEDVADAANEEWEAALDQYRDHLSEIHDCMPSQVRKMAGLCLHDAEVVACDQTVEPDFLSFNSTWSATSTMTVGHEGAILTIVYRLWDRIREHPASGDWPFSKAHPLWLFEEIDLASSQRGMFIHRILFSDGRRLEIPFVSAIIHNVPLAALANGIANGHDIVVK